MLQEISGETPSLDLRSKRIEIHRLDFADLRDLGDHEIHVDDSKFHVIA